MQETIPIKAVPQTFIVRLWQEKACNELRATLTNTQDGQQHSFSNLPALVACLINQKTNIQ